MNLWSILINIVLKLVGPLLAYLKGRGDEKLDATREALKGMRDVKETHDRIERDPAERLSVRDEYK
jgi:hypothetical protein